MARGLARTNNTEQSRAMTVPEMECFERATKSNQCSSCVSPAKDYDDNLRDGQTQLKW